MIPNFVLLGKEISAYMLMALIGGLIVLFFTYKLAPKYGLDDIHMLYMMLFSSLGVLGGGHILYGITNMDLLSHTLQNLHEISSFSVLIERAVAIFGGSVFYGGLIGSVLVCMVYLKHNRLPVGPYADVACLAIPLFHFFGRLGCFLSGCCYGIEWAYGLVYHHSMVTAANGVPRFPVQLVEATLNLVLFFLLFCFLKKERCKNHLLPLYLTVYPVYRFFLEFLRGDEYRGFLGPLSTSQIISVGILFGVSVYWITCAAKLRRR